MPSSGAANQPAFRRIADFLRAGIDDGTFAPGSRLPSEAALVAEHGVAKETVRAAVRQLRKEGLVETRKGAGAFVRDFRIIVRKETTRVSAEQWGSGRSVWESDLGDRPLDVDSTSISRGIAPDHVARVLGVAEVWIRYRRYLVEGRPVMISTSYIPASIADGTPITQGNPGPGGIYARLADLGRSPTKFTNQVRSRIPALEEASVLGIGDDTPVLVQARTAYDHDGVPVEVNEMVLDSTVYILQFDYDA